MDYAEQQAKIEREERVQKVVDKLTDMVNTSERNFLPAFLTMMSRQHRTLQQSFTRLCFAWIEYVGSVDYPKDPRNEASHIVCKEMVKGFEEKPDNPMRGFKPSQCLPYI